MRDNTRYYRFEDGWKERVPNAGYLNSAQLKDLEFEHGELLSVRFNDSFIISDCQSAKNKLTLQDMKAAVNSRIQSEIDRNGYIFANEIQNMIDSYLGKGMATTGLCV